MNSSCFSRSGSVMRLIESLGLSAPCAAAVIGCGGKTSLIESAANFFANSQGKKVLVSPTTKMYPISIRGVDCSGILNPATGKLEAWPEDVLAELARRYDVVLLEADGSKGLPLKGWRDGEPVIPPWCTHTVGVVTLNALGRPAARETVHRLPEFLSLTGLREGEAVTVEALEAAVCAPLGMFKNAAGLRSLLVNQVEDERAARLAQIFLETVKKKYPKRFARLLYGSVHRDTCREV